MATTIQRLKSASYLLSIDTNQIVLAASVGFAQPATSSVYLDGSLIYSSSDSSWQQNIGLSKDLRGKKLDCVISVSDLQPNPNTSIDWKLTGGASNSDIQDACTGAKGDLIIYTLTIYFI